MKISNLIMELQRVLWASGDLQCGIPVIQEERKAEPELVLVNRVYVLLDEDDDGVWRLIISN